MSSKKDKKKNNIIITILISVVIISTSYIIYINQPTSENNPQEKVTNEGENANKTKKLNIRLYNTSYKNFFPFVKNYLCSYVLKQIKYEPNFIDTEIDTEIEKNDLAVYVIYRANKRLESCYDIEILKKLKNKCNLIIIILRHGNNPDYFECLEFKENEMEIIEYDITKNKKNIFLFLVSDKNSKSKSRFIDYMNQYYY